MLTNDFRTDTLTCPLRQGWCSFRVVDEFGNGSPYAGLTYTLTDSQNSSYNGTLDENGYSELKQLYCGPLRLDISARYQGDWDPWYNIVKQREHFKIPLTALQVAAEQTPSARRSENEVGLAEKRAKEEGADYYHLEVRDFLNDAEAKFLPDASVFRHRPSPWTLKQIKDFALMNGDVEAVGVPLEADTHHVLEIKALRAYSPLLSRDKTFCALNAYQLALMSLLSYGPFNAKRDYDEECTPPPYYDPASIGCVLGNQLPKMIKPTQFSDGKPFHLLYEEVPYSKRLEIMPYDPERYEQEAEDGWEFPEQVHFLNTEGDTQAFITHSDKVLLISVRGTQEGMDASRDADARQVPHADGLGQAHRGFHDAFLSTKKFIERYLKAFYTGEQTIIVTAHSLGGAIATLLAEWIRRFDSKPDVMLYTYGSPRVGDKTFVREASELTHHRLVNSNDPVPGVPSTWMDAEWKALLPGIPLLISSRGLSLDAWSLTIGGLVNLEGDDYQHHGDQRHFVPRVNGGGSAKSILWQPKSAMIEMTNAAQFAADIALEADMPKRKSVGGTLMSAAEHMLIGGYGPAALANLLRWRAAAWERDGQLFTAKEAKELLGTLDMMRDGLRDWQPGTYLMFEEQLTRQPDLRFSNTSRHELKSLYDQDLIRLNTLKADEENALRRARKRLKTQADYPISREDVFGDALNHEQFEQIVGEWLALTDVQKAQRLAKAGPSSNTQVA